METDKQAQEHGKQAYCDGAAVQCSRPIQCWPCCCCNLISIADGIYMTAAVAVHDGMATAAVTE